MIIRNVQIINPHETIKNADIEIKNGKIKSIQKIVGTGDKLVVPGFIDIHTHGLLGFDVMDGKDALEQISRSMISKGTTSFLPTLMTAPYDEIIKVIEQLASGKYSGSQVLGFHLEGPFISHAKKGAHDPNFLLSGTKKHFDKIIKASNYHLKKIVIAPESVTPDVVKYLVKQKIIVSIGHSNVASQEVDKYIKAGVSSCAHLWNGMSGVQNRAPGIAQKVLMKKEIMAELICDFAHVDKETLIFSINYKGVDKITIITDSIRPAGLPDGESVSGGLVVIKNGSLIQLKANGQIAGGGSTMHDNFKNILSLGFSMNDAVRMTSTNQALQLNVKKGIIAKNYDADILVLNNNDIERIFLKGIEWKL